MITIANPEKYVAGLYERLSNENIEVGNAIEGDKYTTLDGMMRTLTKDMLMIKNGNKYFGVLYFRERHGY